MTAYVCQAPGVGRSGPLVLHPVSPPQDPVRAQSATTHVPATLPPVGQPSPRLHSPIKRAQLPDTFADSTKVLDERALSDDLPPPPDLYYPPTPTMAPVSGDRPTDGDGNGNGCSSSSSGSPENTARSACQQLVGLVAIAASVRAIERNIPYDNGQRKCIICGYVIISYFPSFPNNLHSHPSVRHSYFLRVSRTPTSKFCWSIYAQATPSAWKNQARDRRSEYLSRNGYLFFFCIYVCLSVQPFRGRFCVEYLRVCSGAC